MVGRSPGRRVAPLLLTLLLLSACGPPTGTPPAEFNALPLVDAELNDADPLHEGASIVVTLVDEDGETCALTAEVSFNGGVSYAPATLASSEEPDLTTISCTRAGLRFTVVWASEQDLGGATSDQALLRFTPFDETEQGPPHHLPIELDLATMTVGGVLEERPGATGAQFQYLRLGLAHLSFSTNAVEVAEEYLAGGDSFESGENGVEWHFDLPIPPPEHHFHALALGPGHEGTGAFYLPFVWRDSEEGAADPALDAGEELVGVGGRMLLGYLRPDGGWADEGWTVMEVDPFAAETDQLAFNSADTPIRIYLKGYPVNGTTHEFDLEVPVENAAAIGLDPDHRCGLMPWFQTVGVPAGYQELTSVSITPTTTTLSFEVDDAIADEHWLGSEWGFFADDVATERLMLYLDDGPADGEASVGELATHVGIVSSGEADLSLIYLDATMVWEHMWTWAQDECWSGFNVLETHDQTAAGIPGWTCHPLDAAPAVIFVPR